MMGTHHLLVIFKSLNGF